MVVMFLHRDSTICPLWVHLVPSTPALGPLERDCGPNCAAGLVLVLSVDTVPQLDTEHYNRVQAGTALATA